MRSHITCFYRFVNPHWTEAELVSLRERLLFHGRHHKLKGLILLSGEGINASFSGTPQAIAATKMWVHEDLGWRDVLFKDSVSSEPPYLKYKVQFRDEIVTMGTPGFAPDRHSNNHLEPAEFHELMMREETVTLDTRNDYEVEIGKFKNAINPRIDEFREFPERLKTLDIPRDKTVLIYCTGGIRCEKAILEMKRQGYEKVYQLEGGILNYLEYMRELSAARPSVQTQAADAANEAVRDLASDDQARTAADNASTEAGTAHDGRTRVLPASSESLWEGECFVFDRRVAVGPDLSPTTRYALCPHCGQAASRKLECLRCDNTFRVCVKCADVPERQTCSKNCYHHYQVRPGKKGPQQRKVHL